MLASSWRLRFDLAAPTFAAALLSLALIVIVRGMPVPVGPPAMTADSYGKLPVTFVPNQGQVDRRVRFYSQEAGRSIYFTRDSVRLAFPGKDGGYALGLTPLGANPDARPEASDPAPGRVNYFIGSERHTNIPTYGEVAYRDLWPGIDLVFHGQGAKLKYELRVAPGADPSRIRFAYRGADALKLGAAGDLLIRTPAGNLRDSGPVSYQQVAGKRTPVASGYAVKKGSNAYGFTLGASYDRTRPLVIDPAITYSTYLGGSLNEHGNGIATDAAGNAYVAGDTVATNFPATAGAFDTTHNSGQDAFVAKLNATGSALTYATYVGGSGDDVASGVAIDSSGNAYITGTTDSTAYPTTVGAFDTTFNMGTSDIFVTKLNASGSALSYSTYLGGSAAENAHAIAVDAGGQAHIVGDSLSATYPKTIGATDTVLNSTEGVLTRLNSTGSALSYSTYLGGSSIDSISGIKVSGTGEMFMAGTTSSSDFPTTAGAFDTSFNAGSSDGFVVKLNPGASVAYSTYLGGSAVDHGDAIAIDTSGNAYVTGETTSPSFPVTPGAYDTTSSGQDIFVTKLNPAATALVYSTFFGGPGADDADAIAVDGSGGVSIAGNTNVATFPITAGENASFSGGQEAFVTRLNPSGTGLVFSTFLGGNGFDEGLGIALDAGGSTYVTGYTTSTTFPTTAGTADTTANGALDAYVTKFAAPTKGSIIVRKDAVPNDAQDFSFSAGGGLSPAAFQLDDDSNATLSDTRSFELLTPGSGFSVSESLPAGWYQGAATCSDGSPIANISVSAGEAVVCTFTNARLYARPGSATPLRVPLVNAYQVCTASNSTHVAPLNLNSCSPPVAESSQIKTRDVGSASGFVKLKAIVGNPGTPADEADVSVQAQTSDVQRASDSADYTGNMFVTLRLRITDSANGTPAVASGTVQDLELEAPMTCTGTAGIAGSNCSFASTFDTLLPNVAQENKLAIMDALEVSVRDAGANGVIEPPGSPTCPPTCGDGDETVFLREGVFTP